MLENCPLRAFGSEARGEGVQGYASAGSAHKCPNRLGRQTFGLTPVRRLKECGRD